MSMEAEKPRDLQSENDTQESGWCQLHSDSWLLETQGELMFQFLSEGRKEIDAPVWRPLGRRSFLSLTEGPVLLFWSGLQLTG